MKKLKYIISISMILVSCDIFETNNELSIEDSIFIVDGYKTNQNKQKAQQQTTQQQQTQQQKAHRQKHSNKHTATQKLRGCNFLRHKKGGMGSVGSKGSNTDQRKMYVRDITITSNGYSQTYKVMGLRIKHYSFNRNQKKHYMKVLHEE